MILNTWLLSVQRAAGGLAPAGLFTWGLNATGQLGDGTTLNDEIPTKIGFESWSQISTGDSYTVGILSNSRLYAWGQNNLGQLGDGTTLNKSSPIQIGTLSWRNVVAAKDGKTTLAIASNGALYAWGNNTSGQFGDGTFVNKSSPVKIGSSSWIGLTASLGITAAITSDYTLWSWGFFNALGDGQTNTSTTPVQIGQSGISYVSVTACQGVNTTLVNPGLFTVRDGYLLALDNTGRIWTAGNIGTPGNYWYEIAVGTEHVLALRSDGRLFGWGQNSTYSSVGDGTAFNRSSPVSIGTSSWIAIGAAGYTSYAIRSDGALFAWGDNRGGEIGDGQTVKDFSDTVSWTKIFASSNTFFATTSDGSFWGWGENNVGQLGVGNTVNHNFPYKLNYIFNAVSPPTILDFSVGSQTCGVITSNGALYMWGGNATGQVGDNTSVNKSSPIKIGSQSWAKISVGPTHTLAINATGQLFSWGSGNQMGDNVAGTKSSPVQIGTNQASSWSFISAGGPQMMAISSLGHLYSWGAQFAGELGTGNAGSVSYDPRSWTQIAISGTASYAIDTNQTLYVWGNRLLGGLGDGSTVSFNNTPLALPAFSGTQCSKITGAINSTGPAAALVLTDGRLWTWGIGTSGLGARGAAGAISAPSQVLGSWLTVESGAFNQAGLKVGNTLFTWGGNATGQLGDGTTIAKSSPVQIGSESWTQVALTANAIAAIHANGALYTWGAALELGDGSTANRSSPVKIGTESWLMIAGGASGHFAAIHSNGALFTWGYNAFGELGNGTTVNQSSMIQIGASSWSFVGGRFRTTIGRLVSDSANLYTWGADYRTTTDTARSSPVLLQGYKDYLPSNSPYLVGLVNVVLAINSNSHLMAWGNNSLGQLGLANTTNYNSPRRTLQFNLGTTATPAFRYYPHFVGTDGTEPWNTPETTIGLSSWSFVSTGGTGTNNGHTLAIKNSGELWAWGNNVFGNIGDGTTTAKSSPVQIGASSWKYASAGAWGSWTSAAIAQDDALFAWGLNERGSFGDGTTINKSSPVRIGTSSWLTIAATGWGMAGSLKGVSGNLYAWGVGANGARAAYSTTTNVSSPVQVGLFNFRVSPIQIGTNSWSKISAGLSYAVGLLANGQIYSWGLNSVGQLGDGTTTSRSSPVFTSITSGISWAQITSAEVTAYARAANGALYAWGGSALGQLGDGTTVNKSSLVKIGNESWTQISAGGSHAMGILANNKLAAWGLNARGQLGDGTTVNKSSPVVIGAESWSSITAGVNTAIGVNSSGALFTWGDNQYGQLAQGTTISRSSPIQVGIGTSWWKGAASDTGAFGTAIYVTKSGTIVSAGYNNTGAMGDNTIT
jgi:alpha-tubulin suppressor-like RCC1 family protein